MRQNLAAVALLLAGAAAVRSPMQAAAQGSLRYTVELEGLRETAQRLELRMPGWRLLALERGAGLDTDYLAFGLSSAWLALGPVAPRGLLRALADPLTYSPNSEVFAEPTGFRLEGALQGASRRGLWLEPLPGCLGLFALHRPPESAQPWTAGPFGGGALGLVQAGAAACLRRPASRQVSPPGRSPAWRPAFTEARALALLSLPPAPVPDSSPQDWLYERPPFPGGSLLHLAGSLRRESGAAGGRLACFLLGAASGGQRVPAGLLGLWRLAAEGGTWSAQGLLGACTADYRQPEGELYPGAWAAGLRLELRPWPALCLAGCWQCRVDRPPPVPEGTLPKTEEGGLSARLELPLRAGGCLEARAEANRRAKYAADGAVQPSAGAGLDLALRGKPGSLGLILRGDWKEDGTELRGQLCGERRGVRAQAGAAGRRSAGSAASGFHWRPFGRLELSGQDFLFWISAGGAGEVMSLGWSASQRLSVSPTSRTSRSRR